MSLTLKDVIKRYKIFGDYRHKSSNTKANYEQGFELLFPLWGKNIKKIKRKHILDLMDKFQHKPATMASIRRVASIVFTYALNRGFIDAHPAMKLKIPKSVPHKAWTEQELSTIPSLVQPVRIGVTIGRYTGQRFCDIFNLRWSDIWMENISFPQQKTKNPLKVPIRPELQIALDEWKNKCPPDMEYILSTKKHGHLKPAYFRHLWYREKKRLKLNCVLHGLRKTVAIELAEAGCTPHEIAAITGHKTLGMIQEYTREVRQLSLAQSATEKINEKLSHASRLVGNDKRQTISA